jgi:hypothetical protein
MARRESPHTGGKQARGNHMTPFERDLGAVIRSLPNRMPPERRSFDRRPPHLGSDAR